jgi:glycosyltransferase involved in cell wall biosynthesis
LESAWLITHDEHIDRRIYFFADVLKELGYKVKLFASLANDEIAISDPPFVCRPELTAEIINVAKPSLTDIASIEDAAIRNALHDVVLTQQMYFQQHNRYADAISQLHQLGLGHVQDLNYTFKSDGTIYWIGIKRASGNNWYIYSNLRNKVRVIEDSESDILDEMYNIITVITKKQIEDVNFQIKDTSDILRLYDQVKYASINVAAKGYDDQFKLRISEPGNSEKYFYDSSSGEIHRKKVLPFSEIAEDMVLQNKFDFTTFRKHVFDYSPILTRVKHELEEERPSIVYVADLPTLPIGKMLKDTIHCKLIVDCHEWWKEQSVLWEPQNKFRIKIIDQFEKQLYPACDMRITVGNQLAQRMADYFKTPFETIYSCVSKGIQDHAFAPKEPDFWNKELGIPPNSKVAVFQGSITTLRNLDNLARSTRYLGDGNCLVIMGGGHYEDEFRKIIESEGDASKVHFMGWVEQEKLMKYTRQADIGVLPYASLNDYYALSVPNKFLEYYNAHLPILCDKTLTEISNIVNQMKVGICVNCADPVELGQGINKMLNDPELLQQISMQYAEHGHIFSYESQKEHFIDRLNARSITKQIG